MDYNTKRSMLKRFALHTVLSKETNNINMRCGSYRTENTVHVHYKDQSVNGVGLHGNSTGVCAENNAKDNTRYGKIQCFLKMQQVTQPAITGC
jgi:hypothetical protein